MKNTQPIRALLGMNQYDMAMVLGVSRSHYAMFEIGKRDLPANATKILAEMLANVQAPVKVTKKNPLQAQINKAMYSKFEQLLHENEYQQALISKKILQLTKKYEKQTQLTKLANYFKSHPQAVHDKSFGFTANSQQTTQDFNIQFEVDLASIQVKQEVLILGKEVLETKMKNIKLK